jgi:hypothetical protein
MLADAGGDRQRRVRSNSTITHQLQFERWEAAMGTPLTPMQKAERDIEELRRSIRRMFRDHLSNLTLSPEDRAAISRGIKSLQDDLRWEQKKFERGN